MGGIVMGSSSEVLWLAQVPRVDPNDTLAVLEAAEEWLSDPSHWTTHATSRNADGGATVNREEVASTCLLGAIELVSGTFAPDVIDELEVALGDSIEYANDHDGYESVMTGLRLAIAMHKARL